MSCLHSMGSHKNKPFICRIIIKHAILVFIFMLKLFFHPYFIALSEVPDILPTLRHDKHWASIALKSTTSTVVCLLSDPQANRVSYRNPQKKGGSYI